MARQTHDPLWEVIEEKVPLQGAEPDIDAVCPHCGVRVHIGSGAPEGPYSCGLCGGRFTVTSSSMGPVITPLRG